MFNSTMKKIFLGSFILLLFSCKEKSTGPENQSPVSFTSQYSKCLSNALAKSNSVDSIFTYSFYDTLIIDFSVIVNCCPDSNRFSISYNRGSDTLGIAVADTARDLCNCVCLYMVHAEFSNLPNDHYIVRCTVGKSPGQSETIHLVQVNRGVLN